MRSSASCRAACAVWVLGNCPATTAEERVHQILEQVLSAETGRATASRARARVMTQVVHLALTRVRENLVGRRDVLNFSWVLASGFTSGCNSVPTSGTHA